MIKQLFTLLLLTGICFSINAQKFDSLALTPPMGWNSWNYFDCDVSEDLIKEIADAMVSSGMKNAGYEYIVIDDCWQVGRDSLGNIIPDPERFPSGMKALGDYIHSKGLKFGIYSCGGRLTCQKRPGSRGYEYQDARSYASWGVDFLKYDWCNAGTQDAKASYTLMRDALYAAGRPVVFSICEWGDNEPWLWADSVGHLWRTTSDIQDCWDCEFNWGGMGWIHILDKQVPLAEYAGPDGWNDPDMLEVGNDALIVNENRAHFSLWCMLAAPLMAGNDLRNMDKETIDILTNKNVIAINQDSLGRQAFKAKEWNGIEMWVKPLSDSNFAVCFFNRNDEPVSLSYEWGKEFMVDMINDWEVLPFNEKHTLVDVWKDKKIGTTLEILDEKIPGRDVLLLKLTRVSP